MPGVKFSDALVRLFDLLGHLFHLRDQRIRILFLFFQARNLFAGFVAHRLALLVRGDLFPAVFIQFAKTVQIQGDVAALRHFGKEIEMFTKITQIVHGGLWSAPFSALESNKQNSASPRRVNMRSAINNFSHLLFFRPDAGIHLFIWRIRAIR